MRYLNVRNTIQTLVEYAALPIINENARSVRRTSLATTTNLAAMSPTYSRHALVLLPTWTGCIPTTPPRERNRRQGR